jgi:hypothetical protein
VCYIVLTGDEWLYWLLGKCRERRKDDHLYHIPDHRYCALWAYSEANL